MNVQRIHYLDSLRGVAALSVVLSHFVAAYSLVPRFGWIEYSPLHLFYDGFAAVSMFFVLSGFVLSLPTFSHEKEVVLHEYVISRVFRIYPSYFAVLVLSLVLSRTVVLFPQSAPSPSVWIQNFWLPNLDLDNFWQQAFFNTPREGQPNLVPQAWTLGVELTLSLLVPFLALSLKKSTTWFALFVIGLLFLFHLPDYLFQFALGVFLAKNAEFIRSSWTRMAPIRKTSIVLAGILLYTFRFTIPVYFEWAIGKPLPFLGGSRTIWAVTGLGAAVLLSVVFSSSRIQRWLESKLFRTLGRWSYSIYLVHFLVLIVCVPVAIHQANIFGFSPDLSLFMGFVVLVGVTVGLSGGAYYLLERPFIFAGKTLLAILRRKVQ